MKSTELVISVVIPMYNAAATIVRALDSVKRQTYRCGYQILIVDDGSDDNSREVVDRYMADNPQMDITIVSQPNRGVSAARNAALRQAEGDYIAFLDSDDEWDKNKIDYQVRYLENEEYYFVAALRNRERITFPYRKSNDGRFAIITLRRLLCKVVGQTSTVIFRREILTNTGFFDEQQRYSEDANYWMRISLNNKMIILNKVLVSTDNDYGSNGLSANMKEMERGVKKNIRDMYAIGAINAAEYLFFNLFSTFKYIIRLIRW